MVVVETNWQGIIVATIITIVATAIVTIDKQQS